MKKLLLLTSLLPFSCLLGGTEQWVTAGGGDWGVAGNWLPAVVPNAVDEGANFLAPLAANCPVTLTTVSPTIGSSVFENIPNASGYIISSPGANALTFQVSSGNASLTVNLINNGVHEISAPIALVSNLDIVQHSIVVPALTISGVMHGVGAVSKSGIGVAVLSGQNTFTGGLTVLAGELRCGQAIVLPTSGLVTMTGGTLNLNNNAQTIGALAGSAPIALGSAILTVNTTAANSYGGVISGTGGLTVGGTGSLTLTNTSNYLGLTTVTSGTLQLGVTNALPAGPVTLTGGVLDLNNFNQSVGSLSATGGRITLGTGQLSITLTQSKNFAGVISGAGSVNFNGGGLIWTLQAAQTYTGGTTIDNGTIQLAVTNGLPSGGPVTLTGTGIFNLNNFSQTTGTLTAAAGALVHLGSGHLTVVPTASTNFAGVIDGAGGVTFQGPSTWTIQAAQTYTGGTTINGGIFQMGVANGLSSTGTVTINNPGTLSLSGNPLAVASIAGNGTINLGSGSLTLNTTGTTTFSGPIVGAGGQLIVQGSGTQILTGTNSYSGGTTVSGTATLQGNTNSLQGTIVNNSTLYFNQAFNGTFAGPLSGTGALLVSGGGIVTLTGTPVQGSAVVLGGELDIGAGSTFTATTITVNSGATIGGDGTFTANVLNSGTVNPGSVVTASTLTVNGNFTFLPGSSYIADLTPTSSDHLIVNGQITINPNSTVIADVQKAIYEEDTQFVIISSTLPVMGTFQDIEQTDPFLTVNLLYNQPSFGFAGSVVLDLQITSIGNVIKGGNAGAIAKCITQAHMKSDHDLEQLIARLIFLPVDEVREILEEMQPSQLRSLTVAEETSTLFAQQTLNWRMAQFDRSTCEKEMNRCFPWDFWVSLGGNWTEQRPADHNIGYSAPAAGFMAGFDGRVSRRLYLGMAVEYGHTVLDWKENQGSSIINRLSVGPYLSYIGRFGYANASLLASIAHFNAQRHIPFFDRTASSSHGGESIMPHLDAGVVFHPAPQVSLTPFAMVDLLFGWEDGYQEIDAESLNFRIASSSSRMLRSELGLKIAKCAIRSHTKWVHDLKASWVREERFRGKELTAAFRQFPCSFTVEGLFPSRSFFDVGMGLTFIFKGDKLSATLRYEGQFGESVSIQSGVMQLLSRF